MSGQELPPIRDSGRDSPAIFSSKNQGKGNQTKTDRNQNDKTFKNKMSRYSPAPKLSINTSTPGNKTKRCSWHSDSSARDNMSPVPKLRPNRSFNLPNGKLDSYFDDTSSRDFINQSPNSRDSPIPRFNKIFNRRNKADNYFADVTSRDFINQSPMSQAATVFNFTFRQHQNRKSLDLFKSKKEAKNASEELQKREESPEVIPARRKENTFINTPRSIDTQRPKLLRNNSTSSLNITSPRKILKHSQSESKIVPIEQYKSQTPRTNKKTNTSMRRNYSDQKLSEDSQGGGKNAWASVNGAILSIENTDILTENDQKKIIGTVNRMRRYSSQIDLMPDMDNECDESDSDSDKEDYILDWLIGVESEEADAPPEQVTDYTDEPPQRETAVHVIHTEV